MLYINAIKMGGDKEGNDGERGKILNDCRLAVEGHSPAAIHIEDLLWLVETDKLPHSSVPLSMSKHVEGQAPCTINLASYAHRKVRIPPEEAGNLLR